MKQSWEGFALAEPELSAFGEGRLKSSPAYLATVRRTAGIDTGTSRACDYVYNRAMLT
jgi:hypothetical protein